jgi:hypothetical protein
MTCHQKKIRDTKALTPLADEPERRLAASSFKNAVVREITRAEALPIILDYEWLGTMGTTEFSFGLFFGEYLAGVACFGRTAGSNVTASICGKEYASHAITLSRGACVHWAHPHSATFLINKACDLMVAKGYNIFVAYSDVEADEIGTVYQASNWFYVGAGGTPTLYVHPDGRKKDSRCIGTMTRSRAGRPDRRTATVEQMRDWISKMKAKGYRVHEGKTPYFEKITRRQAHEKLLNEGFRVEKGTAKHRYVHFAGDKRRVRTLRQALKLKVLPYPKRKDLTGSQ